MKQARYRFGLALGVATIAFQVGLIGCASKGYVNEQIADLKSQIDGVERQVVAANARAEEANTLATNVSDRARDLTSLVQRLEQGGVQNEVVRHGTITFGFASSQLSDEAKATLEGILKDLRDHPGHAVYVLGYTDESGDPDYNLGLSERRALIAGRYILEQLGNELAPVSCFGLGMGNPSADNTNAQGRAQNRRAEIYVVNPELGAGTATAKR
jgi:outer membrane protein OmpA-like peptidoglycan-associated protein